MSCATRAPRCVINRAAEVDGAEPLADAVPAAPGDIAALFYTSGTTGKPKGAELTHRSLVGSIAAGAIWPAGLRRDEAVFGVAGGAHHGVRGGARAWPAPASRSTSCRRSTRCEVLDAIESRRATMFVGRAGHVPDAARGRRRRARPALGPGLDVRSRRDAGGAGRRVQAVRGDRHPAGDRLGRRSGLRRGLRPGRERRRRGRAGVAADGRCRARIVGRHGAAGLPVQGGRRRRRGGAGRVGRRAAGQGTRRARRATTATPAPPMPRSPRTAGCAPATWPGGACSASSVSRAARRT